MGEGGIPSFLPTVGFPSYRGWHPALPGSGMSGMPFDLSKDVHQALNDPQSLTLQFCLPSSALEGTPSLSRTCTLAYRGPAPLLPLCPQDRPSSSLTRPSSAEGLERLSSTQQTAESEATGLRPAGEALAAGSVCRARAGSCQARPVLSPACKAANTEPGSTHKHGTLRIDFLLFSLILNWRQEEGARVCVCVCLYF